MVVVGWQSSLQRTSLQEDTPPGGQASRRTRLQADTPPGDTPPADGQVKLGPLPPEDTPPEDKPPGDIPPVDKPLEDRPTGLQASRQKSLQPEQNMFKSKAAHNFVTSLILVYLVMVASKKLLKPDSCDPV